MNLFLLKNTPKTFRTVLHHICRINCAACFLLVWCYFVLAALSHLSLHGLLYFHIQHSHFVQRNNLKISENACVYFGDVQLSDVLKDGHIAVTAIKINMSVEENLSCNRAVFSNSSHFER